MTNSKYRMIKKGNENLEKFKVTIVADSNDGDYITTIEEFDKEEFDKYIVDGLVDLLNNHGGEHELENFDNDWISIPHSDWGVCHTLESVDIEYIDYDGTLHTVILDGV